MKQPIGVFDSGIGGLSVLREIRALLPNEDLLYVADSGFAPYGHRSAAFIIQRALSISEFLLERGAKAIVVACNTATAVAIEKLRQKFVIPIVGMEPGIKPAAAISKSKVIGVLATEGTLNSDRFSTLLTRSTENLEIIVQPCPGLVEQIEAGDFTGSATRALVVRYVLPLLARGADTLVLGCTHYPLLRTLIAQIAGPAVHIIDTGPAVALQLQHRLVTSQLHTDNSQLGTQQFWTSSPLERQHAVISRVLGQSIQINPLPSIDNEVDKT
ncbi:MAG: glutamate racemase [Candidatus Competibacteraceae bacterium]|jgi:glutamate racemase|nr:glutamate racemase [Candidatus Competibacteraceae bacterium]